MKLVGRGAERRRLMTALADPDTGLVILRGQSGAGKTFLVESVLSDLAQQGTVIGRAKYAEGDATSGFAPILLALSQAVSKALDLLYDPAAGADSLLKAIGSQLSLLESAGFEPIDVLSSPKRMPSPALHGGEGRARIIDAIARLIRWLYGFGTPVVLFIDDWQRAPQDAHVLVILVTRDQSLRLCTVIFAERSGETELSSAKRAHAQLIELGPLGPEDQIALLGEAVGDHAAGTVIDAWLDGNNSGLPFDLKETARALLDRSAIAKKDGAWIVDSAAAASIDRHDVTDTIVTRAHTLPRDILEIGAAFALWGDRTPLARVAEALNRPVGDIERAAQQLQRQGIVNVSEANLGFVHDSLRLGLLEALGPAAKIPIASAMSERLRILHGGSALLNPALRFRIAAGLQDAAPGLWRDLFAREASLARNAADNATANSFAEASWTLRLREPGLDREADALILREASLASAARRDSALMRSRVEEMIALAMTDEQVADAYQTAILAASMAGEPDLAWTWALAGLRRFGLRLPAKARKIHRLAAVARWHLSRLLPRRAFPAGHNAETIPPLRRVLNFAALIAYARDPALMLLCSLHSSTLARRFGYRSANYQSVDAVLYGEFGNLRKAAELGTAIANSTIPPTAFGRGATLYRAFYLGLIWSVPMTALRDHVVNVYDVAISEGDVVYAAQAVRNFARIVWRSEPTLDGLVEVLKDSIEKAEQLGDAIGLQGLLAFLETIRVFRDPRGFNQLEDEPWTRLGVIAGMGPPIILMEILAMRGDWAGVLALANKHDAGRPVVDPHPGGAVWRLHENLARLKHGLPLRRSDLRYIRRVAALNPADHQRKLLILEAERLRQKGAVERCLLAYATAVESASSGSSRLEAGIAAECAAAAARSFGRNDVAARYDAIARGIWNAWGAFAKTGGKSLGGADHDAPLAPQIAEAQLKAALAHRSERAKSRFLAEVGHELRTPLQGMQGLLDLAAEAPSEVSMSELREVFGSLKTVVDDLTDLAALGGGAPLNLKPLDVAALVESESQLAANAAKRKNIGFAVDLQPPSVIVRIDGDRVRQVVRNLLSNAVKYTDRGRINVRVMCRPSTGNGTIEISIVVEDTGSGLTDAQLLRLFEPFERGEREDADGLGLGLALSRRIAERMGGTLTAENKASKGAAFTFVFDAEAAAISHVPEPSIAPLSILLVEDVSLNRRMIATMLRRDGHVVGEAEDGGTALTLYKAGRFDLVLLDVGLPDIDGFQILEAMERSVRGGPAQFIILTASTAFAITERANGMGAARVLHKPVSSEQLRAAIQAVFSLHSHQDPHGSAGFEEELQNLTRQARAEIVMRGQAILQDKLTEGSIGDVHRLAGLAAQFDAPEVASAADLLEAELMAGVSEPASLQRFEHAVAEFSRMVNEPSYP
ncbi:MULTISPECIES: ATP-binding protein [Bradyrhizobium]|uniref:histidine kinase n=2 Tax=Bradyrhizobium TaxID=374 RepID=A0ABY0Q6A3_9BRAD|nr:MULTISPECIES: ATP-binding protein [Bradyrhizobium]SDJ57955.1 His Kinase A (phospho-acceptor) domain-containing protein [Bradyrhizobium ottawaense]SEC40848.1 His Kinase A (phospho-acceptor) domain-containing protein [Bradyrhizobium lablabi]